MIVLIDNGHGANTPGKCSPDKQIREYSYARKLALNKLCDKDKMFNIREYFKL